MVNDATSMFAGDVSVDGRRERLERARGLKDAYTNKIGGKAYVPENATSNVNSGVFTGGASGAPPAATFNPITGADAGHHFATPMSTQSSAFQPGKATPTPSARMNSNITNNVGGSIPGQTFTTTTNVTRTKFEVTVTTTTGLPIVDMTTSEKRRQLIFHAVVDRDGTKESTSVQVPLSFDLKKAALTSEDFDNGRVSLVVPAINSNALSWE
eukprot:CAMPEP_0179010210 /NCGR_PEP_ID=MMETSP0795-20121207/16679_1 /TAXON_ID=88552 /ORGANISM="Amoebophrya sp., Strain Ameob2" /LENGTH=211 /DNA_ID=CAMNT_0020705449 /DNA_START=102 /DNA_END=737 /DNA_ORIENTATION=+